MSAKPSIFDVAKAAEVSTTTVSRVINGKLDTFRIGAATQERVRTAARQLGYQPNQIAREIALRKGSGPHAPQSHATSTKTPPKSEKAVKRQIGILLSSASTPETLNLIPSLIPALAAANYRLLLVTIPTDQASISEQVTALLSEGLSGILSCPLFYPGVAAATTGKLPTLVLWPGAGKALLTQLLGPDAPPTVVQPIPVKPEPVTATPEPTPTPKPEPEPIPVIEEPEIEPDLPPEYIDSEDASEHDQAPVIEEPSPEELPKTATAMKRRDPALQLELDFGQSNLNDTTQMARIALQTKPV